MYLSTGEMNTESIPFVHCELDFSQGFIYYREPVTPDFTRGP